jgi:hypothetical protein
MAQNDPKCPASCHRDGPPDPVGAWWRSRTPQWEATDARPGTRRAGRTSAEHFLGFQDLREEVDDLGCSEGCQRLGALKVPLTLSLGLSIPQVFGLDKRLGESRRADSNR